MGVIIELRLKNTAKLSDIEQFVQLARSAGADGSANLESTFAEGKHEQREGWRLEIDADFEAPEVQVHLPAPLVRELLDLLNMVSDGDGDVRDLLTSIRDVRDEFLGLILDRSLGSATGEITVEEE